HFAGQIGKYYQPLTYRNAGWYVSAPLRADFSEFIIGSDPYVAVGAVILRVLDVCRGRQVIFIKTRKEDVLNVQRYKSALVHETPPETGIGLDDTEAGTLRNGAGALVAHIERA